MGPRSADDSESERQAAQRRAYGGSFGAVRAAVHRPACPRRRSQSSLSRL